VIGRNANIVEAVMPGRNLHAQHINKIAENESLCKSLQTNRKETAYISLQGKAEAMRTFC
jgi:hypothetical protein